MCILLRRTRGRKARRTRLRSRPQVRISARWRSRRRAANGIEIAGPTEQASTGFHRTGFYRDPQNRLLQGSIEQAEIGCAKRMHCWPKSLTALLANKHNKGLAVGRAVGRHPKRHAARGFDPKGNNYSSLANISGVDPNGESWFRKLAWRV